MTNKGRLVLLMTILCAPLISAIPIKDIVGGAFLIECYGGGGGEGLKFIVISLNTVTTSGLNPHNGFTWTLITGYEYKYRLQREHSERTGF